MKSVTLLLFHIESDVPLWWYTGTTNYEGFFFTDGERLLEFFFEYSPKPELVRFVTSDNTVLQTGLEALAFLNGGFYDAEL